MNNVKVLVSTGTIVGKNNNFNEKVISNSYREVNCDGFEFMVIEPWYGRYNEVAKELNNSNFVPDTIHLEKKIGIMLGYNDKENIDEAIKHYKANIDLAKNVGSKLAVLHFWGGEPSDKSIKESIKYLPDFYEYADKNGIVLTIENIPCKKYSPFKNLELISKKFKDAKFIFDTRFGAFHNEFDTFFNSKLWENVIHMHISDYRGEVLEWEKLRPIYHPGEGVIDFYSLFKKMPKIPNTMAIESPVLSEDGFVDIEKMNRTVEYIKNIIDNL